MSYVLHCNGARIRSQRGTLVCLYMYSIGRGKLCTRSMRSRCNLPTQQLNGRPVRKLMTSIFLVQK